MMKQQNEEADKTGTPMELRKTLNTRRMKDRGSDYIEISMKFRQNFQT